jgi:hypothetical protein
VARANLTIKYEFILRFDLELSCRDARVRSGLHQLLAAEKVA